MIHNIQTDETGRILVSSSEFQCGENDIQIDLPDDFDFERQADYRIVDGALIYDPLPEPPEPEPMPTIEDRVADVEEALAAMMYGGDAI